MKQWLRREEDRKTCWTSDHFSNLLLFAKMADQTTIFQLKYWNCSLRLFAKTATEQLSAATQGATRSAWRPFSRVVHRRAAVRFALIYAYMMLLLCFVQIRQTCRYADVARSTSRDVDSQLRLDAALRWRAPVSWVHTDACRCKYVFIVHTFYSNLICCRLWGATAFF